MEYFLPLSLLAMLISSISIYLIDYKKTNTTTDTGSDQSTPNSPNLEGETIRELNISENQGDIGNSAIIKDNIENIAHNESANLKNTTYFLQEFEKYCLRNSFSTTN